MDDVKVESLVVKRCKIFTLPLEAATGVEIVLMILQSNYFIVF
jgi:hypothetical protein